MDKASVRPEPPNYLKDEVRQIDSNTWLIGHLALHRSTTPINNATWHDPADGSSYIVEEASRPLVGQPIVEPDSPLLSLVESAGGESALWAIGSNVICKIRLSIEGVTPEVTTLEAVQARNFTFATPKVLYHATGPKTHYIFMERIPGIALDKAWINLDQHWQEHYVQKVADIYEEMAAWKSSRFGGVDGRPLPDTYLQEVANNTRSYTMEKLLAGCKDLGMDAGGECVFTQPSLGPEIVIVEERPSTGEVAILDFEAAGFYPPEWGLTVVMVGGCSHLNPSVYHDHFLEWKEMLSCALADRGFKDVSGAYISRYNVARRAAIRQTKAKAFGNLATRNNVSQENM